ncbi:unnamed protein product [Parnassius apollo]|uniref:(apollo) hypothetical protein n=1 Tax=Parnassius apollo TaxID=110799 RepID=A0A8S3W891_PARAO|nr:unnamed protein product [Parnassius apollo]
MNVLILAFCTPSPYKMLCCGGDGGTTAAAAPSVAAAGAHAPTSRVLRLIGDMLADDNETDLFADSLGLLCSKALLFLTSNFDIL